VPRLLATGSSYWFAVARPCTSKMSSGGKSDKVYTQNALLKTSKPRPVLAGYGQHKSRSSSIMSSGYVPPSSSTRQLILAAAAQVPITQARQVMMGRAPLAIPDTPDRKPVAPIKAVPSRPPLPPQHQHQRQQQQQHLHLPLQHKHPVEKVNMRLLCMPKAARPPSDAASSGPASDSLDSAYGDAEAEAAAAAAEERAHRKRELKLQKELRKKKLDAKAAKANGFPSSSAAASTANSAASSSSSSSSQSSQASQQAMQVDDGFAGGDASMTMMAEERENQPVVLDSQASAARALPPPRPRPPVPLFSQSARAATTSSTATTTTAATNVTSRAPASAVSRQPSDFFALLSRDAPRPAQAIASAEGTSTALAPTPATVPAPAPLPAGQISDNFVRRNLKKKGSYRQKQKDPRFQRKTRGGGDFDDGGGRRSDDEDNEDEDEDEDGDGAIKKRTAVAATSGGGGRGVQAHGLAAMGLDPLQVSLDAIAKSTASSPRPQHQHQPQPQPRPRNSILEASTKSSKGVGKKRQQRLSDAVLEEHAPCCPGHQFPAKLLVVKKTGANKNRRFYGCAFGAEQRCKFFLWAEDNPALVALALAATDDIVGSEGGEAAERLKAYCARLDTLNMSELKDEARRFQQRRVLGGGGVGEEKMTLSGSREKLVSRIRREAAMVLGVVTSSSATDTAFSAGNDDQQEENEEMNAKTKAKAKVKAKTSSRGKERVVSTTRSRPVVMNDDDDDNDVDVELEVLDDVASAAGQESSEEEEEEEDEEEGEDASSSDDSSSAPTSRNRKRLRRSTSTSNSTNPTVETDPILKLLRGTFGHASLRSGQRWAMERCIAGQSSLLVMPTGSGKSLCYMLPAAALPGLTLVVCPLISLMQDQLKKLPPELPGACFSGSPTAFETAQISQGLLRGTIKVLFVSPERLCTPSFRSLVESLNRASPTGQAVSLLCVDESHTLSQWSYNFRPSFLRIRREMRVLRPRAVLALTATAPPHIQQDIMGHLGIDPQSGLLALPPRRNNLALKARIVSGDEEKRRIVLDILRGGGGCDGSTMLPIDEEPTAATTSRRQRSQANKAAAKRSFASSNAAAKAPSCSIVYVWKRYEVEALAEYLTASGVPAVGYHAGMDADKRQRAQTAFANNKARVVVATVAFGMGVDKADVRCVVHSSLPKSVENYLQETGRAGRDGKHAECHLLLDRDDLEQQHSLSFSSRLGVAQVRGLLSRLSAPSCTISLQKAERELDLGDAAVETILSVLELPPLGLVTVEGTHFDVVTGQFRCRSGDLEDLRKHDPIIKALLLLGTKTGAAASKKQQAVVPLGGSSGMSSSATYGFGVSGGFDEDAASEGAEAYGRQPFGPLSLLRLATAAGLTRDECARGMHALQARQLLEYKLSDPAVYVSVSPDLLLDGGDGGGNDVAQRVTDTINSISDLASSRTLDMWRLGAAVANSSSHSSDHVSALLCHYLDKLAGGESEEGPSGSGKVEEDTGGLLEAFNAASVPLIEAVEEEPTRAILHDVALLRQDPRLLSIVNGIANASAASSSDRQQLFALYIARLLHGLSSPLLPAANWRGHSCWAKYRGTRFEHVARIVNEGFSLL